MLTDLTPDKDTCVIYLVRHGATDANMAQPYILQGCTLDLPLNQTGQTQLTATARKLAHTKFDVVYSSYLKRAQESASIIATPHQLTPQVCEGLHEINVGEWEGLSWDRIALRDPEYYARYILDSALTPYKGGESYTHVAERALPAMYQLGNQHLSRKILVVAHNIVNRVIIAHALGMPLELAKDLKQSNGCINILRWKDQKLSLVTLNEISHLCE